MRADARAPSSHEAYVSSKKKFGRCGGDLEDKSKQINKMGGYAWIDDGKANCAIGRFQLRGFNFMTRKSTKSKFIYVKYRKTLYWTFSTGYGVRALEK